MPNTPQNSAASTDPQVLAGWMKEIRDGFVQIQLAHERNANTERRIVEYENRSVVALNGLKQQVVRVHERLDIMEAETSARITVALTPVNDKVSVIEKDMKAVRSDLDGWINRGRGAWFVASICAAVFQLFVVAALAWALSEVKGLHDWRISVEAVERRESAKR